MMGTRLVGDGVERVYEAAGQWVERALRTDDSLFTPGKAIWSSQWLGQLRRRFQNVPEISSGSFYDELQRQLTGSPPEVYQLMGEVMYIYLLIVRARDSTLERKSINGVLEWSPTPAAIPPDLVAALTPGIARPGASFHFGVQLQVGFLIQSVSQAVEGDSAGSTRSAASGTVGL